MKKTNKKGFTIVELVIVIAVIAILAGVLIPTFSGVIKKAHMSNCEQVAAAIYKEVYALDMADGKIDGKGLENEDIEKIGKGKLSDTVSNTIEWNNIEGEVTHSAKYVFNANGTVDSFAYSDGKYTAKYAPTKGWTVIEGTIEEGNAE